MPQTASFVFDSQSREVVWNTGTIEAFQYSTEYLTLVFEIEAKKTTLTGLQTGLQIEQFELELPIPLIKETEFVGQDSWTFEILTKRIGPIDSSDLNEKELGGEEEIG